MKEALGIWTMRDDRAGAMVRGDDGLRGDALRDIESCADSRARDGDYQQQCHVGVAWSCGSAQRGGEIATKEDCVVPEVAAEFTVSSGIGITSQ